MMKKIKKILIAVDESPISEKVATEGFYLGKQLKSEIALVSVIDTTLLITDGNITPSEFATILKKEYQKNQQLLIDKVFKDCKIWTFIEKGKPYEAILKVAEEWQADLIVLGTHGRTGFNHLLMGSVAEKIIRHTTIPVFIITSKS